jgi:hypothetical protein
MKAAIQTQKFLTILTTILIYGSESWTIKSRGTYRIQSVQMRYFRVIKDCTRLDHIKNDIRKELKIQSVQNKIGEYTQNWINYFVRMTDDRMSKQILQEKPTGT